MGKKTIFNKLTDRLNTFITGKPQGGFDDVVLYKTNNKEEYETMLQQKRQNEHYSTSWKKATYNMNIDNLNNLNYVRLMYRDVELMDDFPEIGTGLDILMEEVCHIGPDGNILNINSKNPRIKHVLEDLFFNRLSIDTILPMITRGTCKYGNDFELLNIDDSLGIIGWKQLPVVDVERYEGKSIFNNYTPTDINNIDKIDNGETHFVWRNTLVGGLEVLKNFQVAHFRLLFDNRALPMGISYMNKARRHFRMLMMMEDLMLVYRLERSMERRVYKINIGGMDPNDAESYMDEIANKFKRTSLVDPQTGQIDLYKNILNPSEDYFVPVVDPSEPSPIETLPGASNLTAIEDIQYIQRKVLASMKIPEQYLNFSESPAEGRNLSNMDMRFAKAVNRIQQCILAELNKIAIIHLTILGFEDDLTNFTLTMNNPSKTMEMMELDLMEKKIGLVKEATNDSGHGIPPMSISTALKTFFNYSPADVKRHLNEVRTEKALQNELEKTNQIIRRTGIFDDADKLYGTLGAQYLPSSEDGTDQEMSDGFGGGSSMSSESISDTSMFPEDEGMSEDMDIEPAEPEMQNDSMQRKGFLLTEDLTNIIADVKEFLG